MKKEVRTICFDDELNIEAYRFESVGQTFPKHFHDYYVTGLVESGMRTLTCNNKKCVIKPGNVLLFNPGDSHGCMQVGEEPLCYIGINIPANVMMQQEDDISGAGGSFVFPENTVNDMELAGALKALHGMIMSGGENFEKEELFLIFLSMLAERCGRYFEKREGAARYGDVEKVCEFIDRHYSEHISLRQLCGLCGLSKSTLLRSFTKIKGITPYRYLQSVRISRAKELLESGMNPAAAALETGFSDQSHFTNFFHMYIGLSPAEYRRIFRENSESKK